MLFFRHWCSLNIYRVFFKKLTKEDLPGTVISPLLVYKECTLASPSQHNGEDAPFLFE